MRAADGQSVGDRGPKPDSAAVVVVTSDLSLLDHVLSAAATLAIEPVVVPDAAGLRGQWSSARLVVVGVDAASGAARQSLPRRTGVLVVGHDAVRDEACTWSVPLGASVLTVPQGSDRLASALADAAGGGGGGSVVGVLGGSGGVGASTWAAALAFQASREGWSTLLVDTDPLGGGIDLLLGAERLPGWRWPQLGGARGRLGDLPGRLPQTDGLDLLAMGRVADDGRTGPDPVKLHADQLSAVLDSATRSYDLSVVDLPRTLGAATAETARRADLLVVVVRADLRGLAAAREVLHRLGPGQPVCLVVRRGRRSTVSAREVGELLGSEVIGSVADDAAVPLATERGDPPSQSARSRVTVSCRELLLRLSEDRGR